MRVLLQRVTCGSVRVEGRQVGAIGSGLVLLVGVEVEDTELEADQLADKVAKLRIFKDVQGRLNRSLLDVEGEALVVSQFTLYADARRGRRPSFTGAAPSAIAEPLIDRFVVKLKELGVGRVATGEFGAMMDVEIHNDGPMTIWLDSADG